ncbi:MAG: ankyrin repeat domain-containing protein [Candidatus Dependentiae bacterium]|nr:ankyrin repeat domain-containing protein [Candidatus Dependentiae bacterium]
MNYKSVRFLTLAAIIMASGLSYASQTPEKNSTPASTEEDQEIKNDRPSFFESGYKTPPRKSKAGQGGSNSAPCTPQRLKEFKLALAKREIKGERSPALVFLDQFDPQIELPQGQSPLRIAARSGSLEVVQALIKKNADPNSYDGHGDTPAISASRHGNVGVLQCLLEAKADKDHANRGGDTSLICAARNGHVSCLTLLIQQGADIDCMNEKGITAFGYANKYKKGKCIEALKAAGAQSAGVTCLSQGFDFSCDGMSMASFDSPELEYSDTGWNVPKKLEGNKKSSSCSSLDSEKLKSFSKSKPARSDLLQVPSVLSSAYLRDHIKYLHPEIYVDKTLFADSDDESSQGCSSSIASGAGRSKNLFGDLSQLESMTQKISARRVLFPDSGDTSQDCVAELLKAFQQIVGKKELADNFLLVPGFNERKLISKLAEITAEYAVEIKK